MPLNRFDSNGVITIDILSTLRFNINLSASISYANRKSDCPSIDPIYIMPRHYILSNRTVRSGRSMSDCERRDGIIVNYTEQTWFLLFWIYTRKKSRFLPNGIKDQCPCLHSAPITWLMIFDFELISDLFDTRVTLNIKRMVNIYI